MLSNLISASGSASIDLFDIISSIFEFLLGAGLVFSIIYAVAVILMLVLIYNYAERKGRSGINWIILFLVFGWITLVILNVSPSLNYSSNKYANSNGNSNASSGYSLTRSANATNVNKTNKTYIQNVTPQDKSGWKCSCGQVNNPNAMRCINCGSDRSINKYWNCPNCSTKNSSTYDFCPRCGTHKPN